MTAGDPERGRDDVRRTLADDAPTAAGGPPLADDRHRSAHGEFLPGTVLAGRYRIVSLLGRGGMGEVYRADDLKLGQTVHGDDEDRRAAFRGWPGGAC